MSTSDVLDRVAGRCRALAPEGASMLAAVSGGGDSTALLFMLQALKERCAIRALGVSHVNHGLRGRESDEDEIFVAALARRLQVPFYVKRLAGLSLHAPGMEARARSERYRFFSEVKEREGYDYIATGHTADDQAETVILRIMRGTGLKGLRGILTGREDGVIRPLIDCRRAELAAWLTSQGLHFRHDASNDDPRYFRNRIRLEVLPALERSEPGARRLLLKIAANAVLIWNTVEPAVRRWVSFYVKKQPGRFIVKKEGMTDGFHATEGLRIVFEEFGIPTDSSHIDKVVENRVRTGGQYLLPGGAWRYHPRRSSIVFSRGPLPGAPRFAYALSVPGITECPDIGSRFVISGGLEPPETIEGDDSTVFIDRGACGRGALVYRSWRSGDTFVPIGSKRSVNVKTFLSKQGIRKEEREACGVVAAGDGTIVWIPGVRLSQRARVTARTRNLLKIWYQSCPVEE